MSLGFKLEYTKKGENANLKEILNVLQKFLSDWKKKTPNYNYIKVDDKNRDRFVNFFVTRLMYDITNGDKLHKAYQALEEKNKDYILGELSAIAKSASKGGCYCNPILIMQMPLKVSDLLKRIQKQTTMGTSGNRPLQELLSFLDEKSENFFLGKFQEIGLSKDKDSIFSALNKSVEKWSADFDKLGFIFMDIINDIGALKNKKFQPVRNIVSKFKYSEKDRLKVMQQVSDVLKYFKENVENKCKILFPQKHEINKELESYKNFMKGRCDSSKAKAEFFSSKNNNKEYKNSVENVLKKIKVTTYKDLKIYDDSLIDMKKLKMEKDFVKTKRNLIIDCDKTIKNMDMCFEKWYKIKDNEYKTKIGRRLSRVLN